MAYASQNQTVPNIHEDLSARATIQSPPAVEHQKNAHKERDDQSKLLDMELFISFCTFLQKNRQFDILYFLMHQCEIHIFRIGTLEVSSSHGDTKQHINISEMLNKWGSNMLNNQSTDIWKFEILKRSDIKSMYTQIVGKYTKTNTFARITAAFPSATVNAVELIHSE